MSRILLLSLLAYTLAAPLFAADEAPPLPPNSLWIESGQIKWNGPDLLVPPEMSEAKLVTLLFPVGVGKVVWIEETRMNNEVQTTFRLNLADLKQGTSRRLLDSPEPLGGDTPIHIEAANLKEDGSALLVRFRLSGSGYFSEVWQITLADKPQTSLLEDVTVWDSQSGDGSVKAAASWGIVADESRTRQESGDRRYGVLILSTPGHPEGQPSWKAWARNEIQPWQDRYLTSVAVAPDGSRVAYINPRGLWLYKVTGGDPSRRLELVPGKDLSFEGVVFAPDGAGLYLTLRRDPEGPPAIYYLPVDAGGPRLVKEGAEGLCLPRM